MSPLEKVIQRSYKHFYNYKLIDNQCFYKTVKPSKKICLQKNGLFQGDSSIIQV